MAEAVDLGVGGALGPDRAGLLSELALWIERTLGEAPLEEERFRRALTHASRVAQAGDSYERLEYLGDRVLGLAMAEWLFEAFPGEPEGQLSKRLNALVTGAVCADVARGLGVPDHVRLGKQAASDGAADSDNVLGDVMEALLGAFFRERGWEASRALVRRLWADRIHVATTAPQHPKSALQEWAAANKRAVPAYAVLDRSGPGHAPRFTVQATVGPDAATATGTSKQEAETGAAAALLAVLDRPLPKRRKRGSGAKAG